MLNRGSSSKGIHFTHGLRHTPLVTLFQSVVKMLGRENIWNLRKDIYEDYGAGTPEDLQGMEKEFDKALYRGKPMRLCDSMPEYLTYV